MEKNKTGFQLSDDDQLLFGDVADALSDGEPDDVNDDDKDTTPGGVDPNDDDDNTPDLDDQDDNDDDQDGDDQDDDDDDGASDPDDDDDDSDGNSSSPLIPYAKMLVEDEILPGLDIDKFDGTADGLKEAMRSEVINGIEQYKESLPPQIKQLIDGYEDGVPFDKILKIKSEQIKVSSIEEDKLREDEEVQKKVIEEYYKKTTKFSDDRIAKSVNRLAEIGDLEEESVTALKELKELTAQEEQQAKVQAEESKRQAEEQYKAAIAKANDIIDNSDEFIPGIPASKAVRERIKKNITIPVGYDQNGNPVSKLADHLSKNPIESEIMLNYLFEVTGGFKDFSVFGKKAKSKVLSDLEKAAKSLDDKAGGKSTKKSGSATANDFYKALEKGGFV